MEIYVLPFWEAGKYKFIEPADSGFIERMGVPNPMLFKSQL